MSIVGVGVDIEMIERFSPSEKTDRLAKRIFTESEELYCRSQAVPARHFAVRFAAKEAAVKALCDVVPNLLITQVEVYKKEDSPVPLIRLVEGAALPESTTLHVSLSHSGEYAVAYVVAEQLK